MYRCGDIPPGLRHLLLSYPKSVRSIPEAHEDARRQLYQHLYGIIWVKRSNLWWFTCACASFTLVFSIQFGSQKTVFRGCGGNPTYVYPEELRQFVRTNFSKGVKKYSDPKGSQVWHVYWIWIHSPSYMYFLFYMQVYHVTIKDLSKTRWPAVPK